LLRYVLDVHPRLACPPESKFIGGLAALIEYPQLTLALASLGVSREDVFEWFRQFTDCCLGRYAARYGKARWVDKTPNYYRLLPLIDEMFSDRVLYVALLRCPFDTIDSLETAPYFTPDECEDPDIGPFVRTFGHSRETFARYWTHVYGLIHTFSLSRRERVLSVRYEELVHTPEATIGAVLDFIGESYVEGMLSRAFSEPHTIGFGDWKIPTTTRIHQESVGRAGRWSKEAREHCWRIVEDTASPLGYASNCGLSCDARVEGTSFRSAGSWSSRGDESGDDLLAIPDPRKAVPPASGPLTKPGPRSTARAVAPTNPGSCARTAKPRRGDR
jgi:hypothetical protein